MDGNHFMNGFYLALVYLVISANYLGNLFGCRVQQMFSETMWLKHVLGLFTTYFLIVLASPPQGYTHTQTLGFSVFIYAWFFLTTKMHVSFWIPMILCVMGAYCIYIYLKQRDANNASNASNAGATDKKVETPKNPDVQTRVLEFVQNGVIILAGILTVVGVAAYYGEKKLEYGKRFDPTTFWQGRHICKQKTPHITITKSLQALFS